MFRFVIIEFPKNVEIIISGTINKHFKNPQIAGNICRSPIAEAVFIDTVTKAGQLSKWEIDSAAIGSWHVGRKPDERAQKTMQKHNLAYDNRARQVLQF